jgi:hypothetical protein
LACTLEPARSSCYFRIVHFVECIVSILGISELDEAEAFGITRVAIFDYGNAYDVPYFAESFADVGLGGLWGQSPNEKLVWLISTLAAAATTPFSTFVAIIPHRCSLP